MGASVQPPPPLHPRDMTKALYDQTLVDDSVFILKFAVIVVRFIGFTFLD